MKRVFLILTALVILTACNSALDDLLKEANEALEDNDFTNATKLYELVLAEEADNAEAKNKLALIENFHQLEALQDNGDWEKAFDQANDILKNENITTSLKDEVKEMLDHIEEMKEREEESLAEIKKITKLLQQNEIDDAKKKMDALDTDIKSSKAQAALTDMYAALDDAEDRVAQKEAEEEAKEREKQAAKANAEKRKKAASTAASTPGEAFMDRAEKLQDRMSDTAQERGLVQDVELGFYGEFYEDWDHLLNDTWSALKKNMNTSSFENLKKEQNDWIKAKEANYESLKADNAAHAKDELTLDTMERTYYLIEYYLN